MISMYHKATGYHKKIGNLLKRFTCAFACCDEMLIMNISKIRQDYIYLFHF
jgi:hypothetical protein